VNTYKITIIETNIYDCVVEALDLGAAKQRALSVPNRWSLDKDASFVQTGDEHYIRGEWETASE
jgi:hypothetical protein